MRKVFIDCGANDGCSVRCFRDTIPGADEFEIHSFEANPNLNKYFPIDGVQYYNKAVWVEDGTISFYNVSVDKYGNDSGETGASTVCEQKALYNIAPGRHEENEIINVESIDLSKWIMSNFNKDDFIVLKLDVEGAEYDILPKMIEDGSMQYVNELLIEFHNKKCGHTLREDRMLTEKINSYGIPITEWDADKPEYKAHAR